MRTERAQTGPVPIGRNNGLLHELLPCMPRAKSTSPRKNSLVANINRRKRKGTSRPKSRSTVSSKSYREMQRGWPRSKKKKKK